MPLLHPEEGELLCWRRKGQDCPTIFPRAVAGHTVGASAVGPYHQQRCCFGLFPATSAGTTSVSKHSSKGENLQGPPKMSHPLDGGDVVVDLHLRESHQKGSCHQ